MAPLVSVVMPVFNGAATITRAVASILGQVDVALELIVIDDGSTDTTAAVLAGFDDPRLTVVTQENRGVVASRNRGIGMARGRYIANMDADDLARPDRLARQVEFLEDHPKVMVVGSAARVVYADGTVRIRRRPRDTAAIRRNIVRVCPFFNSSVVFRREAFDGVGLYDGTRDGSRTRLVADYDLWVRMVAAGHEMANLPDVLITYHRTAGSVIRRRSLRRRLWQQTLSRVDAIRRLGLGPAAYANIPPVLVLSVLSDCGLKLDGFFNVLSARNAVSPEISKGGH
jgi:glycosyltransferase involved in cell wall biosynthesis